MLYTVNGDIFTTPASLARATVTTVTEIEIALADIGISTDGLTMPIAIYMDSDCVTNLGSEDFAGGAAIVGTGSPTTVTLTNIQSESQPAIPVVLVVFMVAALMGTTIVIKKRSII